MRLFVAGESLVCCWHDSGEQDVGGALPLLRVCCLFYGSIVSSTGALPLLRVHGFFCGMLCCGWQDYGGQDAERILFRVSYIGAFDAITNELQQEFWIN